MVEIPPPSKRSLKTRNALLTAGVDLLATRSIDAISIDELVQAARVAKGTFFNHFDDKQKFAELIARQIRVEMETRVGAINRKIDDPAERLVRGMCLFIALALNDPKRATILLRGHEWATEKDNPLNAGLYADLHRGVESGRFFPPP
jgi:AcrR family transcriptional regulator